MRAKFEKVVAGEDRLFRASEFWTRAYDGSYHFHPEIELTAILAGNGRRIVGDHIETFIPGDLVLIGPNLPHQYAGVGTRANPGRVGCLVIQFLPEALGCSFLNSREGALLRALLDKARRGVAFRGQTARDAITKMRAIVTAEGSARFIALVEVLDALAASGNSRPLASHGYAPLLEGRHASRISRACEFIQRRFEEPIRQTDAAAHVAISPPAFSRMFRRATGLTFTAFLTGIRLSEASRRLLETDDTVAQICYRCGFSNLSNFNRRFLVARGMTPREFRRASAMSEQA